MANADRIPATDATLQRFMRDPLAHLIATILDKAISDRIQAPTHDQEWLASTSLLLADQIRAAYGLPAPTPERDPMVKDLPPEWFEIYRAKLAEIEAVAARGEAPPAWHTRLLWWLDDHGGAPRWYVAVRARWLTRRRGA